MSKNIVDAEKFSAILQDISKEISEKEDPVELDEYRRIFKQNVSVFQRAYVAAYMLKYFKPKKKGRPASTNTQDSASVSAMSSLFVSIGRSRRIAPRDLIGFILDKTTIERGDIGNIKVMDNYSFIEIASNKIDIVIQTLHGHDYRGKILTVSQAKKRHGV